MKTIVIAGTFDSKGEELLFIKKAIEAKGFKTLCIHTGVFESQVTVDIENDLIAEKGGENIDELAASKDRGRAMAALSKGFKETITELFANNPFDGIISIGGSGGTALVSPGMRALPVGLPKIIVSTMASGNVSQYVGTSDIILIPSIVDVAGLNRISKTIFNNACSAICGMASQDRGVEVEDQRPLIGATMFGVTTPCVEMAKAHLEKAGYEVLVFHASGTGGKTMEALIDSGYIAGVLDITTTEWCDELVGGVLKAGPHRLEAASRKGIPQVVSVGALDMVNFGAIDTVPEAFANRNLYEHNPTVTLMRTSIEENIKLGEIIAEKLNAALGKTVLMVPLKGVSMIDQIGQPFYGPMEDKALFDTLRNNINPKVVKYYEMDAHINEAPFALEAANQLLRMME